VRGFSDDRGRTRMDLVVSARTGLLGLRLGDDRDAVMSSPDGLTWSRFAAVPRAYQWGGSEGLLTADGAVLLFSDNDEPGGGGHGNRLGGWRLLARRGWVEVVDLQPAFTYSQASGSGVVIVVGDGWDRSGWHWPWIMVSVDWGRGWDAGLSWAGAARPGDEGTGCLDEVAILGGVAVVLGCDPAGPAIWATTLPDGPSIGAEDGSDG
jgi:hypothetical protein